MRVIDLSNGGLLLESASQILPGARVELFLVARDQRWLVKGMILRCQVARVVRDDGVRYQAALAFNEPMALLNESTEASEPRAMATDLRPALGRLRAFAIPSPMPADRPPGGVLTACRAAPSAAIANPVVSGIS